MATSTTTHASVLELSPEDLRPSKKVGLRIPLTLLLIPKLKWMNGGSRVQPECQELLEEALRRRSDEADERATAFAEGTIGELAPALGDLDLPLIDDSDLGPVTVTLSRHAMRIATKLALGPDGQGSIQKVCEPLLCAEHAKHTDEAIAAARAAIDALRPPDKGGQRP